MPFRRRRPRRPPARRVANGAWALVTLILVAGASACDPGRNVASPALAVQRDTIGDTVVVRTVAGSVWGDSVRLVEELRIGEREGGDEYGFGRVGELVVGADGTLYVFDHALGLLRAYDPTGRYLRTVGGKGSGPGEYRAIDGLAVHRDGRILLHDPREGRILQYSAAGEPLGAWARPAGLFTGEALRTDSAGFVFQKVLTGEIQPDAPWPMGYVRLDGTGRVIDTLPAPTWAEAPARTAVYDPVTLWTMHPHGYYVAAFGARYAVDLRRSPGLVLRIERAGQPVVPVPQAERDELEAIFAAMDRAPGRAPAAERPPVPDHKPAIRALATGDDGRIWVRPSLPSVERAEPVDTTLPPDRRPRRFHEPEAWDVFEADGSYLGRVSMPPRATIRAMRGDTVWGVATDDDDVPYIVRWRIVHAGGH